MYCSKRHFLVPLKNPKQSFIFIDKTSILQKNLLEMRLKNLNVLLFTCIIIIIIIIPNMFIS